MPARGTAASLVGASVLALKLAIGVGLCWALVHYRFIDIEQLSALRGHVVELAAAGLLTLASIALATYRWRVLLREQGVTMPFRTTLRVVCLSTLSGMVLPGIASGDAVRFGYVAVRLRRSAGPAVTSVIVDRIIGTLGLVTVGLALVFPVMDRVAAVPQLYAVAAGFALLLLGAGAFILIMPIGRMVLHRLDRPQRNQLVGFLVQILEALRIYRRKPLAILWAFVISFIGHSLNVAAVVIVAWAILGGIISPWAYAFAVPASLLANVLPLTPGGLGVGEAAFSILCGWLAVGSGAGAAFGTAFLAFRVVAVIAVVVGAVIAFALVPRAANDPRTHADATERTVTPHQ
jgi:uncharacterized protein (TIRG00374 family)